MRRGGRGVAQVAAVVVAAGAMGGAVAGAQGPAPDEFGGGSLDGFSASAAPTTSVALRRYGERFRMRLQTGVACPGNESYPVDLPLTGRVRGEAFSTSGSVVRKFGSPGDVTRLTLRYRVRGSFAGDRAEGTIRVIGVRRRGGSSAQCRRRADRTFVVRRSARVGGGPATPAASALYAGSTAQRRGRLHGTMTVRLNRSATRMAAVWTVLARCARPPAEPFLNITPLTPVRNGRAVRRERFTIRYTGGVVGRYRASFDGRFRDGGVKGTVRLRITFRHRGHTVDRCDSGPVEFAALPA